MKPAKALGLAIRILGWAIPTGIAAIGLLAVSRWVLVSSDSPLMSVRERALNGMSDDRRLEAFLVREKSDALSLMAISKLKDLDFLARNGNLQDARGDAVRRRLGQLIDNEDQVSLAAIALEPARSSALRRIALTKLTLPGLDQLIAASGGSRAAYYKAARRIFAACNDAKDPDKDIALALMPLAQRYGREFWTSRFGELSDVAIEVSQTQAFYKATPQNEWGGNSKEAQEHNSRVATGSIVRFAATFEKAGARRTMTVTWEPRFPYYFDGDHAAKIQIADAYIPWIAQEQADLALVAGTDPADEVRRAAVQYIADPSTLGGIARRDGSYLVRIAATARLSDQTTLHGIARSDPDCNVRVVALRHMTDLAEVKEIAQLDSCPDVRTMCWRETGDRCQSATME